MRDAMRDFAERRDAADRARVRRGGEAIPDAFLGQAWELGLVVDAAPGGVRRLRRAALAGDQRDRARGARLRRRGARRSPRRRRRCSPTPIADQGTRRAEARRYLPPFCGERFHAASLARGRAGARPSTRCAPRTARRAARASGFVLIGREVLRAARRPRQPLPRRRARQRRRARRVHRAARRRRPRDRRSRRRTSACGAADRRRSTLDGVRVPGADRLGGAAGCDVRAPAQPLRASALAAVLVGLVARRARVLRALRQGARRLRRGDRAEAVDRLPPRRDAHRDRVDALDGRGRRRASSSSGVDATRSAHQARAYAAEKAMWIADNGVQVLGGHGFIREHPGGDVVPQRAHARRPRRHRGGLSADDREETDDRFRALRATTAKSSTPCARRRSSRATTRATTTRTSTSSRPTSCPRRKDRPELHEPHRRAQRATTPAWR